MYSWVHSLLDIIRQMCSLSQEFAGCNPANKFLNWEFAGHHPANVLLSWEFAGRHPANVLVSWEFAGHHPANVLVSWEFAGHHPAIVFLESRVCWMSSDNYRCRWLSKFWFKFVRLQGHFIFCVLFSWDVVFPSASEIRLTFVLKEKLNLLIWRQWLHDFWTMVGG